MQALDSKLDILGSEWDFEIRPYDDDSTFKELGVSGYCQARIRKMIICDMNTHPDWKSEPFYNTDAYMKETVRHEILHAFLYESGLDAGSIDVKGGGARNEEMIDWFAIQAPKIVKVWQQCHLI